MPRSFAISLWTWAKLWRSSAACYDAESLTIATKFAKQRSMKNTEILLVAMRRFFWHLSVAVAFLVGITCRGQPVDNETPDALVRRLQVSSSAMPWDRALAESIAKQGSRALPALEKELHLGISVKELEELRKAGGSRRVAVTEVLALMPDDKSTDLLVRSLADPPDTYGMQFGTLLALTNRTLSQSQVLMLLRNHDPEVAQAGIVHAKPLAAAPEVKAALETLYDSTAATQQFKNEFGASTASVETVWEVHLKAGEALKKDMLPEIRVKVQEILAVLKAESLHPTRPDAPVWTSFGSEAENTINHNLSRLADFEQPIRDMVVREASSAEGDYARVLEMALVRLGDRNRVANVSNTLTNSPSPTLRCCAALTLRLSGDRAAIPALKKALQDPYQRENGSDVRMPGQSRMIYPVRILAADALISLGEDAQEVRKSMR
jgi:hypothetical protein